MTAEHETWRRVGILLAVSGLGLLLCGVALWAAGLDVQLALSALLRGAFGDTRRMGVTLLRATPLLLTGLGVALAFRAGLWNIGAEGQMLFAAVVVVGIATRSSVGASSLSPLVLVLAGASAGASVGAISGVLKVWRRVPEVISTIMFNFIAVEIVSWAVQGPLRESAGRYPQTDAITAAATMGRIGVVPAGLIIGIGIAIALHIVVEHSRAGLELRASGSNRVAAAAAGVRVNLQTIWVFALSGAIAGVAGAVEIQGSIHRLYEGYAPGYGYTAIAVALLARLLPLAVIPSALFFGALQAGSETMERQAAVPAVVSSVLQAVLILAMVYAWRRGRT